MTFHVLANHLRDNEIRIHDDVLGEISNHNINNAMITFDIHLQDAHKVATKKKKHACNDGSK